MLCLTRPEGRTISDTPEIIDSNQTPPPQSFLKHLQGGSVKKFLLMPNLNLPPSNCPPVPRLFAGQHSPVPPGLQLPAGNAEIREVPLSLSEPLSRSSAAALSLKPFPSSGSPRSPRHLGALLVVRGPSGALRHRHRSVRAARGISAGVKPHAGGPLEAPAGAAARCGMSPCPRRGCPGRSPQQVAMQEHLEPVQPGKAGAETAVPGESLALEILLDVCSISYESFTRTQLPKDKEGL
ncbi:uncharacterized protein [Taeniopygia guttata]|uniref:uncharacterized protein isoform X2 n=1 Tax=Taeniopygia guttata TaxID=59729 RepID=UPI003BB869F2